MTMNHASLDPGVEVTGHSAARAEVATAALFHALADPSRLVILRHLLLGEHKVVELTEHLGLAQSTVSKHLQVLRDSGLVTSRPQGRATVHRVTDARVVLSLFVAADHAGGHDDSDGHCPFAAAADPRCDGDPELCRRVGCRGGRAHPHLRSATLPTPSVPGHRGSQQHRDR